jgi:hypothetical protein
VKNLKWAACLGIAVAALGTVAPAVAAQAQDLQATTVTVTSSKPTASTGTQVNFRAVITPNLIAPNTHISGTVTWTITGSDESTVPCGRSTTVVKSSGAVFCLVNRGVLQAASSPYTVKASYSGDGSNFAPGVGTLTQTIGINQPSLTIRLPVGPSNGGPSTVTATATVSGGVGTPLLTGNVIFSISSNVSTACTNGSAVPRSAAKSVALGSDGSNANVATCQLPAGWITVPSATPTRRHPRTRWTITATFEGNGNFQSVFERARSGWLR